MLKRKEYKVDLSLSKKEDYSLLHIVFKYGCEYDLYKGLTHISEHFILNLINENILKNSMTIGMNAETGYNYTSFTFFSDNKNDNNKLEKKIKKILYNENILNYDHYFLEKIFIQSKNEVIDEIKSFDSTIKRETDFINKHIFNENINLPIGEINDIEKITLEDVLDNIKKNLLKNESLFITLGFENKIHIYNENKSFIKKNKNIKKINTAKYNKKLYYIYKLEKKDCFLYDMIYDAIIVSRFNQMFENNKIDIGTKLINNYNIYRIVVLKNKCSSIVVKNCIKKSINRSEFYEVKDSYYNLFNKNEYKNKFVLGLLLLLYRSDNLEKYIDSNILELIKLNLENLNYDSFYNHINKMEINIC
ncbi:hypothetical protein [Peptostreptococcus faecalis]|uniref:hypothetical protein n=1 Tax=Peptostreptococcus faecalis TaxID=2045015 RepID=UPI000C7A7C88|nr:hypothetical protein [Peptostreptococcus faecalis]